MGTPAVVSPASASVTLRARRRALVLRVLQILGLAAAVVLAVGAIATHGFFSVNNLQAILGSTTFVGMIAVGMTIIMISGSFVSLSLGTTATVCAMFFVYATQFGVVAAILMALLLGCIIGLIQGLAIGGWAANPIILTIAAGGIQQGVTVAVTSGTTITPTSDSYQFLNDTLLGVPLGFYILLVLVGLAEVFMRRTRFGREIYLTGESRSAARAAGFPLAAIGGRVFAIAGACAALAGIMLGAFIHSASLLLNNGTLNYDAIAAALVGGTAIGGGHGSVWRALVGALVIATITDLLLLSGYSTGVQILLKGLIVTGMVVALHLSSNRESR
jgi:ribose/xylose/arabinose/galactoside ABC-type transport system permease subunit